MSHWTTIETKLTDIAALRLACADLGLELLANATCRGYGSNKKKADYAILCQGPYDIAVERQEDGTYGLTTDWFRGSVAEQVGQNFGKLLQLYGAHKAALAAKAKGYAPRILRTAAEFAKFNSSQGGGLGKYQAGHLYVGIPQ